MTWLDAPRPPIIWSVAGTDSGGGAGLSADTRAAAAFGVHLCPVVAAVTAQNSSGVEAVYALPRHQIVAQMQALCVDLRPQVIKTGLLGSVDAVHALCEFLDQLRRDGPVALVIDPVLGASAGGPASVFSTATLLRAYREQLLPRAQLITPNRREAELLLGLAGHGQSRPWMAERLIQLGAEAVCITGGDDAQADHHRLALDWLHSPAACGYLALPRIENRHHHGSGCSFASSAAAAMARGFVSADAVVLAKMATWAAVRAGHAAGIGAGPVRASPGFVFDATAMPVMSFGAETLDEVTCKRWTQALLPAQNDAADFGIYAITDRQHKLAEFAGAGVGHIQLRIKADKSPWLEATLDAAITEAQITLSRHSGCQLWINDHWRLSLAHMGVGLHLGQEDWQALDADERQQILGIGIKLGISSHSLWELARARSLNPHYIACGPVWPTSTKDMPWQPQGLDNLSWWVRMAGRPVVAIGGLLRPEQVEACAASGAAAACLVRALDSVGADVATFHAAWKRGKASAPTPLQEPHPSLTLAR